MTKSGISKTKYRRNAALLRLAEKALRVAIRGVVKEHKKSGRSLVVWEDGRIARVSAKGL
jgi:hypothetical protein